MRLLIVEDDRKLAEFVARGLRAERFAIDLAADGLEGKRLLELRLRSADPRSDAAAAERH